MTMMISGNEPAPGGKRQMDLSAAALPPDHAEAAPVQETNTKGRRAGEAQKPKVSDYPY
ncbi:MAG: hypothetical protein OXR62_01305 [Ahrensia sp.]|nr:hypothetical protein [Ahrensia sp.]